MTDRRLLIMGGSFDPPHKGHKRLLVAAAEELKPDRIVLVPAFQAPLKGLPGASAADRVRMLRKLVAGLPKKWRKRCSLDISEVRAHRMVYTVETLRRLRREHPRTELHFIVGSDSAESFYKWREPEALKRLCAWWVGMRPGAGVLLSPGASALKGGAQAPGGRRIPAHFKRLPGRFPDISSTDIRLAAATGAQWARLTTGPVASFIRKRGLYGLAIIRELERTLKKPRFQHTMAVADLSAKLAVRHGLDRHKAVLAGLLHDCGRCMPPEKMAERCRSWRVKAPSVRDIVRRQPKLLHSYLSAELARRRFGIQDPEVLSAIRKHTLGALRMSPLDKLIYVADAVSEDRDHPGSKPLRELAFRDLDIAMKACLWAKLEHARSNNSWMHPLSLSLWTRLRR
ncbi:MAG: bis(5'-nucleosyl)-tetraphosphatase (symmetrical) YqeK [Elusimicrobia bacterium]|nr:bis(5'-nucleosyl)-tetraphosphatase (symmetrical) YqeK [Elusimicrobiota bacterium]